MKNKILSLIISVVTVFTLTACGTESHDKLRIVTTIFPQYDFAKQIAGDNAEVTLLLSPGAESHSYEPTAADIAKIQQADLFIYNGGESEIWVDRVLESKGKDENNIIRLMDYVSLAEEEHDSHKAEYDEHIFTSLKNAEILLETISEKMCHLDSENTDIYNKNTE
ncbi:MAG: metal ABC transporter substrate-binding protein, partial [Porcipelethomonas sp.]